MNAGVLRSIVAAAVLSVTSAASADPLPVTSGFFRFGSTGSPEFRFVGEDFNVSGFADPFGAMRLRECTPCTPADQISFAIYTVDDMSGAAAQVGGVTYEPIFLGGEMRFDAPTVSAATLVSEPSLTAPFLFTGNLVGYSRDPFGNAPELFRLALTGRGTAFATFQQNPGTPGFPPLFSFSRATYQFEPLAPVPEPATGALIGLGLAALAARRRLRERRWVNGS
jgi:hypothetical protein